jgi:uncharacterized SAM-binding protein YcdF (DUF218 family)
MKSNVLTNTTVFLNLSILHSTFQLFRAICHHQTAHSVVGVCLEGDTTLRLETTLVLFQKKIINYVIVSGGVEENSALDELPANQMRRFLIDKGIPSEAIDMDEKSVTTHEHPIQVLDIAKKKGFTELMIITSRHHLVRAYLRFLGFLMEENLPIRLYGYPAGTFGSLFQRIPKRGSYRMKILLIQELTKIRTYHGLASFEEAFAFLRSENK